MHSSTSIINQLLLAHTSVPEQGDNLHQRFGSISSINRQSSLFNQIASTNNNSQVDMHHTAQNFLNEEIKKHRSLDHQVLNQAYAQQFTNPESTSTSTFSLMKHTKNEKYDFGDMFQFSGIGCLETKSAGACSKTLAQPYNSRLSVQNINQGSQYLSDGDGTNLKLSDRSINNTIINTSEGKNWQARFCLENCLSKYDRPIVQDLLERAAALSTAKSLANNCAPQQSTVPVRVVPNLSLPPAASHPQKISLLLMELYLKKKLEKQQEEISAMQSMLGSAAFPTTVQHFCKETSQEVNKLSCQKMSFKTNNDTKFSSDINIALLNSSIKDTKWSPKVLISNNSKLFDVSHESLYADKRTNHQVPSESDFNIMQSESRSEDSRKESANKVYPLLLNNDNVFPFPNAFIHSVMNKIKIVSETSNQEDDQIKSNCSKKQQNIQLEAASDSNKIDHIKTILSKRPHNELQNSQVVDAETHSASDKKMKRRTAQVLKCPHSNQKHYAKGMCNHCYHKYGRQSNADACPHTDRLVYAKGKCQNCYLNDYNKVKRRMKKDVSLNSKSQTKTEIANNCQEDNLDEDFSLVSEPEVKRQRK